MQIYGNFGSGNCLKVKYIADATGTPYVLHEIGLRSGATKTPEFLKLNPAGEMPVVVLDDGRPLAQSNAILRYLAQGSRFLPSDRYEAAKVDEWLFWEQYSHEPTVAVARARVVYDKMAIADLDPNLVSRGNKALDRLEEALTGRDFLVGETMTIADIALLAYTRQAHEGGFDLSGRPALLRWIATCEQELGLPAVSAAAH
ncbi:Glutathione S-transferase, unnamed subgroup [Devosia sp. H5989]|uniref:Glutathione S-transferase family protein n=1 Tax=Paradevosia tibetensis TaxID=1447062 RepID=A0A5B9DUN7_9HYPH|nr:glutathione S-transferase family protein [Youhaiella tibetensis]AKR57011.1 Glutathione S-transferase, unnamed subgroup [Devosia sp. H5989]QEE22856.1 glutathione S-transferase family protein [Youhaiella tibetensis]